jgi:hypothetical protein
MRLFALFSNRVSLWRIVVPAILAFAAVSAWPQDDPPDQAGRISATFGTVSIQPSGSDDWGRAYPNLPVGPGDRIYTDQDGQVEVQVGQTYIRIGPNSDVTLVNDDQNAIAWGVAQGSVHVRSFGLWQGQSLDLSTANGDARIGNAGEIRVDVVPDQGATIFTSLGNGLVVTGAGGFWQQMGNWQSLQVAGTNPVDAQWLQPAGADELDQWSQQRDLQIQNAASYQYVNPEMPGAADLDANGDWTPDSDYGPVWFPRNVSADWEPYHNGHWINRDPWGWVWVEDESWGYAPFHYGRWVSYRGRWGWVPGPREDHPVWSPALVVFAGGIQVGGVGVSAWFPLGPGEPYRPWYPCSPRYIDRVNITNIHEGRAIHVQTTYVNIVNVRNVTNITYVNRNIGASAMRQDDFAAGRPVRQAAVQVDRRQFDRVQVVDRPAPVTRQSFVPRPVGRPVPVTGTQPVFINQKGLQITNRPGAPPVQPPVRPMPPMRTVPGRTVAAPPQNSRFQNGQDNNRPGNNQPGNNNQPRGPVVVGRPAQPTDGRQMNMPNQPPANNPNQPLAPPRGGPVQPGQGAPTQSPSGNPRQDQPGQGYPNQQPQTPPQGNPPPDTKVRQEFGPTQGNKRDNAPNQPPVNNPPQNQPPQYQPRQGQPTQPPQNQPRQDQPRQDQPRQDQPRQDQPRQGYPNQQPPAQGQPVPPRQERPTPPPQQQQPQTRPAPPPQQPQQGRQDFGQQQQNKPHDQADKPKDNKQDNKQDKKKDDKKDHN